MVNISEGNGPGLVVSSIVPFVFTLLFFAERVYLRWFTLKTWKLEDSLFVASQTLFSILSISVLISAAYGNGQHIVNTANSDFLIAMEAVFLDEIFYTLTTLFIRLSVGFYLLRICSLKHYLKFIIMSMAVITFLSVLYLFFIFLQCRPVSYFWLQFSRGRGSCLARQHVQNINIAYTLFAAATNMGFGVLAFSMLWNSNFNLKARIITSCLLGFGTLASLTLFLRIWYIHLVPLKNSSELLYATSNVSIWSLIEPAITICCLAASTFQPLFGSLLETSEPQIHRSKVGVYGSRDGAIMRGRSTRSVRSERSDRSLNGDNGKWDERNRSRSQDTFDDRTGVEGVESRIEAGRRSRVWVLLERWKPKEPEEGIVCKTTVEITSEERVPDIV